jgi:PAS domain S-box-containing protein
MKIAKVGKAFFVFWLLIPVLVTGPARASDQSPGAGRIIKSASELDYPPFALVRSDGTADGFSVDLLKEVVHTMGMPIDIKTGPWHDIKQQLVDGRLDVLPLVSYSEERDKVFDFSASYLRLNGTVFVREDETAIRSEADLKGKAVIVMKGDNAHEYALKNRLTDKFILTDTYEEALTLLSSGKHDAVLMLQLVGFQLLKKLDISNVISAKSVHETDLKPVAGALSGYEQKFCFAVQEGDKELLAQLNEGLAILIAGGRYDALYEKWFGPILPRPKVSWQQIVWYLTTILIPVVFIIAVIGIWYLKKQVAWKTRHLQQEIQERKKTEVTLQKSENKFRTLFDVAAIPMCYVTSEGIMANCNTKFTQTFGYTTADIPTLDAWWQSAYPDPAYRQQVIDTWNAAVKKAQGTENSINPLEYLVTCKNGETRQVIISGTAFPEYFLATFVDITDLKKTEEQLEATLADLERSNAELQQFAYVASHDLQEPLRAAVGFLQLLQSRYQDLLDEKGNHYIERAVNAGHRMQGLINDLLTLSRVNTQDLVPQKTDMNGVLAEVIRDLQPVIEEKQAAVTCSDLPVLYVDNNQMFSLLQNLVTNALKYNTSPQPAVDIGCQEDGDAYRFYVKDNGIGIAPRFHDRIFMIFQRLHTRREYSGTGIGLALSRKIVERHNGRIWVVSQKGRGSVFYFTLPKTRELTK